MNLISDRDVAKKFAQKIVSEIVFYNQDKAIEGIINDNFFDLLHNEIEEGRNIYLSRVSSNLSNVENLYDLAIVEIIMEHGRNIRSKIWR
ncbi:MAG TPA: hypothetical protein VII00_07120 [bacterium]